MGGNERCKNMLLAFKKVINDYQIPPDAVMSRHLEQYIRPLINHLVQIRPLSVSMGNSIREFKCKIATIPPEMPEAEAKEYLCSFIDSYIQTNITVADEAIVKSLVPKIDNDVILVYAYSSIVLQVLKKAKEAGKVFSVIIADSRPNFEGKRTLDELLECGITSTYSLLVSIGNILHKVTKVIIGVHGMFTNGALMSRVGTSLVAMMAKKYNIPVIACCETYKFCDRVQLDSFVYNEIRDPDELIFEESPIKGWKEVSNLKLLNIMYDITPSEYISVIATEVGILPCTSVPVVIRERNSNL